MRRDDLIKALSAHRDLETIVILDGVRFQITAVAYAFQDPDTHTGNDQLEIHVGDPADIYQLVARYDPENNSDGDLLPSMVQALREMWDDYKASSRGRAGHGPDFYTWSVHMLNLLYGQGFLQVPLPPEVDPDSDCTCMRTAVTHKPRQDHRCLYRTRSQ